MVWLTADQPRIKLEREDGIPWGEGLFCFQMSPGVPGLSLLPLWQFI